jgi:hypothetical protein
VLSVVVDETAASVAVDRPFFLTIQPEGSPGFALRAVQSVSVDEDDAAVDDDGGNASRLLDGVSGSSIGTLPTGRSIAVLQSRVRSVGVRVGIDTPRAPPYCPPIG